MRITLVHPAGFNFVPGQPDFSVLANRMAPIGIMQLASWLEKFGHCVQLHDCLGPYAPLTIVENAEIVLAGDPQMVGFSATTSGFMDAVEIAAYIRARRPEIKIVFGNVHVSSLGAPILEHFPEIDYLVIGEGEGSFLDLADGKPLKDIGNLIYRDGTGRAGYASIPAAIALSISTSCLFPPTKNWRAFLMPIICRCFPTRSATGRR